MKKKSKKKETTQTCTQAATGDGCSGCKSVPPVGDPISDPNDLTNPNNPFNRLIGAVGDIGWQVAIPKEGWASTPGNIGGLIIGTEAYLNLVLHCIEVAESSTLTTEHGPKEKEYAGTSDLRC